MVPTTDQARARVVEHLISRTPVLLSRIGKAQQLLDDGSVSWSPSEAVHFVRSGTTEGVYYRVSLATKSCDCRDQPRQAPHGWCKHLLAVAICGMADEYQARRALAVTASVEAREWRRLARAYRAQQLAAQVA